MQADLKQRPSNSIQEAENQLEMAHRCRRASELLEEYAKSFENAGTEAVANAFSAIDGEKAQSIAEGLSEEIRQMVYGIDEKTFEIPSGKDLDNGTGNRQKKTTKGTGRSRKTTQTRATKSTTRKKTSNQADKQEQLAQDQNNDDGVGNAHDGESSADRYSADDASTAGTEHGADVGSTVTASNEEVSPETGASAQDTEAPQPADNDTEKFDQSSQASAANEPTSAFYWNTYGVNVPESAEQEAGRIVVNARDAGAAVNTDAENPYADVDGSNSWKSHLWSTVFNQAREAAEANRPDGSGVTAEADEVDAQTAAVTNETSDSAQGEPAPSTQEQSDGELPMDGGSSAASDEDESDETAQKSDTPRQGGLEEIMPATIAGTLNDT